MFLIHRAYTSYFYQIRYFTPNMMPLSTAVYDPKWFHQGAGQDTLFLDKHGVINGLRVEELAPGTRCRDECRGTDRPTPSCTGNPETCGFLRHYREQLDSIDFDLFWSQIEGMLELGKSLKYCENAEMIPVFIVHEAADKVCSERQSIQHWLNKNGIKCSELPYRDGRFAGL